MTCDVLGVGITFMEFRSLNDMGHFVFVVWKWKPKDV